MALWNFGVFGWNGGVLGYWGNCERSVFSGVDEKIIKGFGNWIGLEMDKVFNFAGTPGNKLQKYICHTEIL